MVTQTRDALNHVVVEVSVPIPVPKAQRPEFEKAMVNFLFGHDRLRPELEGVVQKRGVNIDKLATLSVPDRLGLCPTEDALEFVPSRALADLAKKLGISLVAGGSLSVRFDYDTSSTSDSSRRSIEIRLGLPETLTNDDTFSSETLGDIAEALFGGCELTAKAAAYLRAHGIELDTLASENAEILNGGEIPPTTRVDPKTAEALSAVGFRTDLLGLMDVRTIRDVAGEGKEVRMQWSRRTCC